MNRNTLADGMTDRTGQSLPACLTACLSVCVHRQRVVAFRAATVARQFVRIGRYRVSSLITKIALNVRLCGVYVW